MAFGRLPCPEFEEAYPAAALRVVENNRGITDLDLGDRRYASQIHLRVATVQAMLRSGTFNALHADPSFNCA